MSSITDLFTEKLRPKNIAQLIAPDRIKLELNKGLIQNLLLYGSPGTGKTSAAYILAEGYTTYYINASTDGRIDLIRDKLKTFCSSFNFSISSLLFSSSIAIISFSLSLSCSS